MNTKHFSLILPGVALTASLFTGSLAIANHPSVHIKKSAKPNVLFIAIDDLNDWVGCLDGHPQAKTPNMDRLAARGVVFTNTQAQAPLCNPSRSSVLTGLRPSSTGIYGLAPGIRAVDATKNCVSLPQYFRKQGYFTAAFGKVFHDGSIPKELQKDEFEVWGPSPGMPVPREKFVQTPNSIKLMDWGIFPEDDREQADWKTADNVIAQLKSRPKDEPFFLAVGFRLPHVPCFASQKWFDMFPPENEIRLPSYLIHDRNDVPFFSWYLHWDLPEPRLSWLKEANQWHNLVRSYLASTTFMDSQIGRLLDALDESGEASNTVIVLWSDNGWHLGEKDITGKNSLWKPSTHVPLIFAGKGVTANGKCTQPAELLDIYPTLLELCGLPANPELEGHSLKPQLKNTNAKRQWPAITTANQNNHAIVTEKWRFIQYADGSQELYDNQKDPNEWTNLASKSEYRRVIEDLKKWLPERNLPLAPGSAYRILEQKDSLWYWEGKPIKDEELAD
ncbi:MAG: sulfatase [Mangrovibacterium sp.]